MEVSHAGLRNVGGFANELKAFLEFHRTPRCLKPIGRVRRLSSKTQLSLALGRQDLSEQGRFLPIENTCEIPPQASPDRRTGSRGSRLARQARLDRRWPAGDRARPGRGRALEALAGPDLPAPKARTPSRASIEHARGSTLLSVDDA